MNGMSGPRDWTPYEPAAPRRRYADRACPPAAVPTATVASSAGAASGSGWAALVFGVLALVLAIAPLAATTETTSAYVLSTMGVIAVALGARAIGSGRRTMRVGTTVLGWVGLTSGVAATVLMIAGAIGFHVGNAVTTAPAPLAPAPAVDAGAPLGTVPAPIETMPAAPFFDLAGVWTWIEDAVTSPLSVLALFAIAGFLVCVGAVTSLRWLVATEQRLRQARRIRRRLRHG